MTPRLLITILLLVIATSAAAQMPGYPNGDETEHIRYVWQDDAISPEGIEALKEAGEVFWVAIAEMTGEAPDHKLLVLLEGPAQRPNGSWGTPHVDGFGRIHLYRYGPTYHDYLGAYAHEMVHAMRIAHPGQRDWFFEEGFAEFVALRVDDDLRGFPWYGYPVVVVAGQWLASDQDIPLQTMRTEHKNINQPCKTQTYTLRSSFFVYLGDTYGDDVVLEMSAQDGSGATGDYEKFAGKDFDTLVAEWRGWLLEQYGEIDDAGVQAKHYLTETPIQYMPACGRDGAEQ